MKVIEIDTTYDDKGATITSVKFESDLEHKISDEFNDLLSGGAGVMPAIRELMEAHPTADPLIWVWLSN